MDYHLTSQRAEHVAVVGSRKNVWLIVWKILKNVHWTAMMLVRSVVLGVARYAVGRAAGHAGPFPLAHAVRECWLQPTFCHQL
mmetsp:Transcript_6845/g.10791  ORF Transcript_6845/g.10791 Transcript_6845/m.10791 type:complete len:83 (-) Transcript_6845:892-1140(-)